MSNVFANEVATVQPGEVAARLAEGWMLLDVRADDEWAGGRIAGSVHIPMDQLMQRMDEVDDRVVCVCGLPIDRGRFNLPRCVGCRHCACHVCHAQREQPTYGFRRGVSVRLAKETFGSSHHMVG